MTKSLHVKYNNDEYKDYFIDKYGNVINSKGKELRQRKINSGYLSGFWQLNILFS